MLLVTETGATRLTLVTYVLVNGAQTTTTRPGGITIRKRQRRTGRGKELKAPPDHLSLCVLGCGCVVCLLRALEATGRKVLPPRFLSYSSYRKTRYRTYSHLQAADRPTVTAVVVCNK